MCIRDSSPTDSAARRGITLAIICIASLSASSFLIVRYFSTNSVISFSSVVLMILSNSCLASEVESCAIWLSFSACSWTRSSACLNCWASFSFSHSSCSFFSSSLSSFSSNLSSIFSSFSCVLTVSYTHLDVYKRQLLY